MVWRRLPAVAAAIGHEFLALAGSRAFFGALLVLLPFAGILVGLDLAYRYARFEGLELPWQFSLSEEGGLGERLEYAISAIAAAALLAAWVRGRAPVHGVLALAFVWITLDNALRVHETGGAALGPLLAPLSGGGIRGVDLAEAGLAGAVGLGLAAALVRSMMASPPRAAAQGALILAALIAGAGFGIGVDLAVHLLADQSRTVRDAADLVEDGAELAILCLAGALAWAAAFTARARSPRPAAPRRSAPKGAA